MGGQKKSFFKVETKGPDGDSVTEKLDTHDRKIAWNANSIQLEASIAAADVQKAGGSVEEMLEAARKAANEKGGLPEDLPEARHKAGDVTMPRKYTPFDRWMLAVARLGNGNFDNLSPAEMLDVICVVPQPVIPFDQWQDVVSTIEEQAKQSKE